MRKITRFIIFSLSILLCCALFGAAPGSEVCAKDAAGNLVVVIDPGHGGVGETKEGAVYNGMVEKHLTLATAAVMKQTLDQFEGVTVYLTRTADVEMSLEERAVFAKAVGADFLFSLHYNASLEHNVYGSEVWIPSKGNLYAKGFAFASVEMQELGALGLYQRGIKTRVGSKGDYYGIIRNCTLRGIPSVIIEHCHMDHGVDVGFLKSPDALTKFGYADAIAVAKYFGLRSSALGLDFSEYKNVKAAAPKTAIRQDETPPEVCTAVKNTYDSRTRTLTMNCTVSDKQSQIIYYAVSYNGGLSFTTLLPWNRLTQSADITVQVPEGATSVIFRAYNQYDKFSDAVPVIIY